MLEILFEQLLPTPLVATVNYSETKKQTNHFLHLIKNKKKEDFPTQYFSYATRVFSKAIDAVQNHTKQSSNKFPHDGHITANVKNAKKTI